MRSVAVSHARKAPVRWHFNVFGSPGAVRIRPGTFQRCGRLFGGGLVTVGNTATAAASVVGIPAAAKHGGRGPKPWAHDPELGRVHADVARPEAHARHDVEGGAEIGGQIEH